MLAVLFSIRYGVILSCCEVGNKVTCIYGRPVNNQQFYLLAVTHSDTLHMRPRWLSVVLSCSAITGHLAPC